MHWFRIFLLMLLAFIPIGGSSCTIVAISGRVTNDGRPLLLKNRDSSSPDIKIKVGAGGKYTYLCQCNVPDGQALSGFNEKGFAIISSHSYNMPNTDYNWNAYIMQLALGGCATVMDFRHLLDSLPKPISVTANYGVMDCQGTVAIFETNSYSYAVYYADSADCGYLVRSNYSISQDTNRLSITSPSSYYRNKIASSYLDDALLARGCLSKDNLIGLARCLVNSEGINLCNMAPFDEYTATPVDFRYYIPRYISTSAMIIQGVTPEESPKMTVAWTMVGPPLSTVTIPFLITDKKALPQKAKLGPDGHSWLSDKGLQLKNSMFVDNTTVDLAKMYNLSCTGIMQKICAIEEEILCLGNELVDEMRIGVASDDNVEAYYSWVDYYLDEQYRLYFLDGSSTNSIIEVDVNMNDTQEEYYDLLGRQVRNVRAHSVIVKKGEKAVVLN